MRSASSCHFDDLFRLAGRSPINPLALCCVQFSHQFAGIGFLQPIATHAPLTVMASSGLTTRRSRSAVLPSPALAAFSRRRRPCCAALPVGRIVPSRF